MKKLTIFLCMVFCLVGTTAAYAEGLSNGKPVQIRYHTYGHPNMSARGYLVFNTEQSLASIYNCQGCKWFWVEPEENEIAIKTLHKSLDEGRHLTFGYITVPPPWGATDTCKITYIATVPEWP